MPGILGAVNCPIRTCPVRTCPPRTGRSREVRPSFESVLAHRVDNSHAVASMHPGRASCSSSAPRSSGAAFAMSRCRPVRRAPVEDLIAERAAEHPRSAQNELAFLKRVLRDARGRGQSIDETVLLIDPVKAPPRRGRALTVEQLYEEHSRRLIPLAGMVGAR